MILELPVYQELAMKDVPRNRCILERLIDTLYQVWRGVKSILCNDAPEGFVPEDMDAEMSITTTDILSYCWRALKEGSSLSRAIVTKCAIGDGDTSLVSMDRFESLWQLIFTQLVELRHRGAFSAVAQCFAACCVRAKSLGRDDLLRSFYTDTLNAIKDKGSATTRRSAGLPSLIVGLLSAAPDSKLLDEAVQDLIFLAHQSSELHIVHGDPLPQVHALNCLRSIFISTALGQYTEPHIATCLSVAGTCLTSPIWAIRNCGLMLFRSLIDRLLGSTESQNTSDHIEHSTRPRVTYQDFPDLLEIVLGLLSPDDHELSSTQNALESVFPALKLLQRIPPPEDQRQLVSERVLRLCTSPHWHVRDLAARTYSALVEPEERFGVLIGLIKSHSPSHNELHGRMLCVRYLLSSELRSEKRNAHHISSIMDALRHAAVGLLRTDQCPLTGTLVVGIVNQCLPHSGLGRHSLVHQTNPHEMLPAVSHILVLHMLLQHAKLPGDESDIPEIQRNLAEELLRLRQSCPTVLLKATEDLIETSITLPPSLLDVISSILATMAMFETGTDPHILATSRRLLFELHTAPQVNSQATHLPLSIENMERTFREAPSLAPSLVEASLKLWSLVLDSECLTTSQTPELLQSLERLVGALRHYANELQVSELPATITTLLSH